MNRQQLSVCGLQTGANYDKRLAPRVAHFEKQRVQSGTTLCGGHYYTTSLLVLMRGVWVCVLCHDKVAIVMMIFYLLRVAFEDSPSVSWKKNAHQRSRSLRDDRDPDANSVSGLVLRSKLVA